MQKENGHNEVHSNLDTSPDMRNLNSYCEEFIYNKAKWYRCTHPECSQTFRYKSQITRHFVTHSNQRPYYCTVEGCGKTFKRTKNLEAHLRIHYEEMPFACEIPGCGFRSKNKSSLDYHYLKHKNEKNYKCSFPGCNKSFLTKAHLDKHEKALVIHNKITSMKKKNSQGEEPHKIVKRDSSGYESEQTPTIEFLSQKEEKPSEVPKAKVFQNSFGGTEARDILEALLNKLQEQNQVLKRVLEQKTCESKTQKIDMDKFDANLFQDDDSIFGQFKFEGMFNIENWEDYLNF